MIVQCTQCKTKMKIADSYFEKGRFTFNCPNPKCDNKIKPDPPKIENAQPIFEKETRPLFDETIEAGWLIVQDKNAKQQSLPLKFGKQTIGRFSSIADKKADIMVDTEDDSMSRKHFIISVENRNAGGYNYCLSDYSSSINKTYLNEKKLREGDEYILKNGDVIRAGLTNLTFKANDMVTSKKEPKVETDVIFGILNNS